ncbi:MAG: aminoacyl-tRNA hydrolase [Candidatus Zixiibacteriota bacterium]|nr:MAG: aminoacyl-tRNA hydrolase [candidate division Zixibacteria bacterium]
MVKAVVGLGNPGRKHRNNRHNLGFVVADYLCEKRGGSFQKRDSLYELAKIRIAEEEVEILKPLTYMNLSGEALRSFCEEFGIDLGQVIVVCDDTNLPLGKIRLRASGSDGGHKGLRSVITDMESEDFPRLRTGIGLPQPGLSLEEYVLRDFHEGEIPSAKAMVLRAYEAIIKVIESGLEEAMNLYNREPEDTDVGS